MTISYTNRRGQTYYLHMGRTKTGKPRFYFSQNQYGDLADAVPAGYEIYEHPEGQVHLRRELPKLITDEEIALLEKENISSS
jgi:hypothetical protein